MRCSKADRRKYVKIRALASNLFHPLAESVFRDWGYELAVAEFRDKVVTERESWILDNKDRNANLSVEQNAAMIEPGIEQATEAFKQEAYKEVKETLDRIYGS